MLFRSLTHVHTHAHIHTHTYKHTQTHTHKHTHIHTCRPTQTRRQTHTHKQTQLKSLYDGDVSQYLKSTKPYRVLLLCLSLSAAPYPKSLPVDFIRLAFKAKCRCSLVILPATLGSYGHMVIRSQKIMQSAICIYNICITRALGRGLNSTGSFVLFSRQLIGALSGERRREASVVVMSALAGRGSPASMELPNQYMTYDS